MKRIYVIFLFLFLLLGLSSCIEDKPEAVEPPSPVLPVEPEEEAPVIQKVTLTFEEAYYQPLNGELDLDFKEKLHALLENTHTYKASYSKVWEILKTADRDPANLDNILCIYTGQSIPIANQDKGTGGNNIWNREHLWPKAKGFKSESMTAHNDCHHLHASEKNINNYRANLDFGEVSNPTKTDNYGNRWNSSYFEPRDEVKGDIARSLFYMVVRYDGDECGNCLLDLELIDGTVSSSMITSGSVGRLGDLSTLLKWHYEDPVDDTERRRNEAVYSYQGNRNPFIDHEEFVSYLYPSLVGEYTDISQIHYLIGECI